MSRFYIKAWVLDGEVVSVFCHGLPITQDPIQFDGATVLKGIVSCDYIHATDLFPTLTYENDALRSSLCEIETVNEWPQPPA